MYAWQTEFLEKMTKFKGRGVVQITGRNSGKSYWTSQAIQRLMDDMIKRPIEDLVLSEGKVYGSRYHCVEPIGGSWLDMEIWCLDCFGTNGSAWDKNKAPEPNARWYMNDRRFWFRDEKDRTMFILKWR